MFAQAREGGLPLAAVARHAARFFDLDVDFPGAPGATPAALPVEPSSAMLALRSRRTGCAGRVSVSSRPAVREDLDRARAAEHRGRAAGMATLAERCPRIWVVEADPGAAPGVVERLLGALASVALGPVLPEDGSTLYGVRGALARAEREERTRGG